MYENLTIEEMEKIQKGFKEEIVLKKLERNLNIVGGMDIAYYKENDKELAISVIVLIDYKTGKLLDYEYTIEEAKIPYISGYFGFREVPLFLNTWNKLKTKPDIMIFDGQGILHPNRMGLATLASFYIDIPTIGVGKTFLHFNNLYDTPYNTEGSFSYIYDEEEILGVAYRSHTDIKPIFISVGNYITLDECIEIIKNMINNESRIPIPTRLADLKTKELRRDIKNKKSV